MRLFLHRLRRDRALQRIIIPIVMIFILSVLAAVTIDTINARRGSFLERADRLSSMGEFADAERFYWAALQTGPVDVPTLIGFIDNRASLIEAVMMQAMSGSAISVKVAISPGLFMPISSTAISCSGCSLKRVKGRPIRLLKLPSVLIMARF